MLSDSGGTIYDTRGDRKKLLILVKVFIFMDFRS
jgi:hypothetical protein